MKPHDQSDELILSMAQLDFMSNLLVVLLLMVGSQAMDAISTGAVKNSGSNGKSPDVQIYLVGTNVHLARADGPPLTANQLNTFLLQYSRTNRSSSPVVVLSHTPNENAGRVYETLVQLQTLTNANIRLALFNNSGKP